MQELVSACSFSYKIVLSHLKLRATVGDHLITHLQIASDALLHNVGLHAAFATPAFHDTLDISQGSGR